MKTVKAGEFKTHCLRLLDDVAAGGEALLVTKRGRPVALVSPPPAVVDDVVDDLRGSVIFEEDLVSPIDEAWEVDR